MSSQPPTATSPSNNVDELFIDEFGFYQSPEEREKELAYLQSLDAAQIARREGKWERMTASWNKTKRNNYDKIKSRLRKGIHAKLRGTVWLLLCDCNAKVEQNPMAYRQYIESGPGDIRDVIDRDLGRTFPTHCLFKDTDSIGQQHLKNVLYAYAACDPEVGYCQGMGFVVGTLLTQMGEEQAFWCLHHVMHSEKHNLRMLYIPGFPLLQQFFFQLKGLMRKFLPEIAAHFEAIGIDPAFYATQWFMTVYSYHFQFRVTIRVWDAFLCEGWKVVFRIALALLDMNKSRLLEAGFEQMLPLLKSLCDTNDPDALMQHALKIPLKSRHMELFKKEYEKTQTSGGK
eukprot:PhM_4_TR19046/c0_g1_i1/m.12592/K19944/TBC1D10; TBC1 domain family member 10